MSQTPEDISKETVKRLSDSVTKDGKYVRNGQCLLEDDWVYFEELLTDVITKEREAAESLKNELAALRKRFDERFVTPNEYAKVLITRPLLDEIAALKEEIANCKTVFAFGSMQAIAEELKAMKEENANILNRIWEALGMKTYVKKITV